MFTTNITIGENDEVAVSAEVIYNSEEAYARNITVAETYLDNGEVIFSKGQNITEMVGVEESILESYMKDISEFND